MTPNPDSLPAAQELLQEIFPDHGVKRIAAHLGMQPKSVNKWAETCDPAAVSPVARTGQLLECLNGDDRLIQYLCRRAGGFFVRNPRATAVKLESLLSAERMANQELADQLKVILEAMADGKLTRTEVTFIRRSWEGVKSKVEAFVQACEQGKWRGR